MKKLIYILFTFVLAGCATAPTPTKAAPTSKYQQVTIAGGSYQIIGAKNADETWVISELVNNQDNSIITAVGDTVTLKEKAKEPVSSKVNEGEASAYIGNYALTGILYYYNKRIIWAPPGITPSWANK